MKRFILLSTLSVSLMMLGMSSCRSVRPAESHHAVQTLNQHKQQMLERDTIHIRDSILIQQRHDTVFVDRWHTAWRERIVCHTDTIVDVQEVTVEKTVEKRTVPRWCWWLLVVNVVVVGWKIRRLKG